MAWWDKYRPSFPGQKWTCDEVAAKKYGLSYIKGYRHTGICESSHGIHYGSNSGFQALNLAIHFGASRIILLGFDMMVSGDKVHWHGNHQGLRNPGKSTFSRWVEAFTESAPQIHRMGVEVVNCSRSTALECFRRSTIEAEL